MASEGLAALRNRYGQEQIIAQEEGFSLPSFEEWVKLQNGSDKPDKNSLASLATPTY